MPCSLEPSLLAPEEGLPQLAPALSLVLGGGHAATAFNGSGGTIKGGTGELLLSLWWRSGEGALPSPAFAFPSPLPFLFPAASIRCLGLGRAVLAFLACCRALLACCLLSGCRGVMPLQALLLPFPLCQELPVAGTPFFADFASPLDVELPESLPYEPARPLGRDAISALLAASFAKAFC